jgi:phosphatidylserine/phosphatidylglycerophosphate/cardiolipin synthase-like enzyme
MTIDHTPPPPVIEEECIVTAFVGPDTIVESLRSFFSKARNSLRLYIFDFNYKPLLDHLASVKAANPQLQIKVLLDPVKHSANANAPANGIEATRQLKHFCGEENVRMGPTIHTQRPVFELVHQKYAVADDSESMVMTANWDNYLPTPERPMAGREWGIKISGAQTAEYFAKLFDNDWSLQVAKAEPARAPVVSDLDVVLKYVLHEPAKVQAFLGGVALDAKAARGSPLFPEKSFDSKMRRILPLISPGNYHSVVLDLIRNAKKKLRIQQMYLSRLSKVNGQIAPVQDGKVQALLNEVMSAFRRGVDTEILIEPTTQLTCHDDVKLELFPEVAQLVGTGMFSSIRFRRVGPSRVLNYFHNKGLLVDDEAVVVSSTNWSDFSITLSREAGLVIFDPEIASWYTTVFEHDFKQALSLDTMQYFPFLQEIGKLKS